MPRRKTCSRCRAAIHPENAWCERCLMCTPWAAAIEDKRRIKYAEWPDIWAAQTAAPPVVADPELHRVVRAVPRTGFHPVRRIHEGVALRVWREQPG
jgi:hypothetical protein